MVAALLHLCARQRSPAAGDAVYRLVRERGEPEMTLDLYSKLLNVFAKAEHPPFGVPVRWARRAAEVAAEAEAEGVAPDLVFMHSLMECQAKAGLAQEALATFHRLQGVALRPDPTTFTILFTAFRRAGVVEGADHVLDDLMPKAGVSATTAVWNSYLGVYAAVGDIDRAYSAWTRMLKEGHMPDQYTERVLVQAFSARPSLAAERPSRHSLSPLILHGAGLGGVLSDAGPTHPSRTLLYMDLHGGSRAAATTLLQRRLELLVAAWPALRAELGEDGLGAGGSSAPAHTGDAAAGDGEVVQGDAARRNADAGLGQEARAARPAELVVVTGVGRGSPEAHGVLRDLVRDILSSQGLENHDATDNPGRTVVPWSALAPFLSRHHTRAQTGYLARAARARYAVVLLGSMTMLGAGILIPRLAPWLG